MYDPYSHLYQPKTIIINGVEMSMTEFNKMRRANKAKARKKKELSEIQLLPGDIKALMKNVRVLKSIVSFYDHGYKQWGRIHRQVLAIDDMGTKFAMVKNNVVEVGEIMEDIRKISKKKEKSVYAYVQKLSYKMNDVKTCLQKLYDVVIGTNVINSPFYKHEIISGNGKRLGLKVLMYKTCDAIYEIDTITNRLQNMSEIPDNIYDKSKLMSYGAK